jgi:hypothetical protein
MLSAGYVVLNVVTKRVQQQRKWMMDDQECGSRVRGDPVLLWFVSKIFVAFITPWQESIRRDDHDVLSGNAVWEFKQRGCSSIQCG